jgi:RNA polymerase sigma-70 factor (ECF subfamily)
LHAQVVNNILTPVKRNICLHEALNLNEDVVGAVDVPKDDSLTSPNPPNRDDFDKDASLMLDVQAGKPLAFEELMERNQTRIAGFIYKFVGNRELAADLTQEVFMRVYKYRATYRQKARFSTWLFRIAHNVAVNELRYRNRRPETPFSVMNRPQLGETGRHDFGDSVMEKTSATPSRQLAKVELQQIVRDAIDRLPDRQREAMTLSRFENLSYKEIADVMDSTPEAIKSLLCRARLNLKEVLAPYVEDGRREK